MSDPFTAFDFRVEIRLPGAAEPLCEAAFAECDGMEMRFEVTSLQEGGDRAGRRLLAGPASFGELTLRRGMTESFDLWKWCVADPSVRADARVVMLAEDGSERAAFRLRGACPSGSARRGSTRSAASSRSRSCSSRASRSRSRAPSPSGRRCARPSCGRSTSSCARRSTRSAGSRSGQPARSPALVQRSRGCASRSRAVVRGATTSASSPSASPTSRRRGRPCASRGVAFRFDGHVEALEETLDLFAPDGSALRAKLALTLRGAVTS